MIRDNYLRGKYDNQFRINKKTLYCVVVNKNIRHYNDKLYRKIDVNTHARNQEF